jgi:hypothetical protein
MNTKKKNANAAKNWNSSEKRNAPVNKTIKYK